MRRKVFIAALAAACAAARGPGAEQPAPPQAVVEVEEDVYSYRPANNGAGPMWCGGSTCLVRVGGSVFASGIETIEGAKPLNNCRWLLFKREKDGWRRQQADKTHRTREPCPLVCLPGGRVLLSANPTLTAPDAYAGPARPEVLEFVAAKPDAPFRTILPAWKGKPPFTEHSYRSFAADGRRGGVILFQNIGYTHVEWSFRDAAGKWAAQGRLDWPWGSEYDKPQPIRICYPTVALRGRAVHFCGVSDIIEPYTKWREYKRTITGQKWDYDFRRLFYTWCDDVATGKFRKWVEIASRDKTCGWVTPRDLWVGPDGRVHLLWSERAIDTRLRKEFFPGAKQSHELNYAIVRAGTVVLRRTLIVSGEGRPGLVAGGARFHVTPDGPLLVVCYVHGRGADGKGVSANRVFALSADGKCGPYTTLAMKHPFTSFFTATVRAGHMPSWTLDLLGQCAGRANTIRYARVALRR